MKKPKFLRKGYRQYSKLGKRRKKKLKYRRARGIDSKVRLKMKGNLRNIEIGFRGKKSERGLINGKNPVLIHNLEDLKNLGQKQTGIVARIGGKKKAEISDYCLRNRIKLINLSPEDFLRKAEEKKKERLEKKLRAQKEKGKKGKKEEKAEESKNKEEKQEEMKESKKENKESPEEKK